MTDAKPYDQLSDRARWFLGNFDELTLAELCASNEAAAKSAGDERDGAYRERAHLVALLAAMTDGAVIALAPDVDEDGWQIAYLRIGGRQATWHISPRDADLFAHVEHVDAAFDPRAIWDGHSTDEKYRRIQDHIAHRWFTPPAHYNRSDGAVTCVHNIPIGPDSCWDCRDLADLDGSAR